MSRINIVLISISILSIFLLNNCNRDDFSEILAPPNALMPLDGFTTYDTTPTFQWEMEGNENAVHGFYIYIDNGERIDFAFSDEWHYLPEKPLTVGQHYWKIIAYNDFQKYPSDTYDFTILALPAVSLINPADQSCLDNETPNFSWTSVENALHYEIQIADDDQFTNIVQSADVGLNTTYTATNLTNGLYFWRVVTYFDDDMFSTSEYNSFSLDREYVIIFGLTPVLDSFPR